VESVEDGNVEIVYSILSIREIWKKLGVERRGTAD